MVHYRTTCECTVSDRNSIASIAIDEEDQVIYFSTSRHIWAFDSSSSYPRVIRTRADAVSVPRLVWNPNQKVLYVCDKVHCAISQYYPKTDTFISSVPFFVGKVEDDVKAMFLSPQRLAMDNNANILVSDEYNFIERINLDKRTVEKVCGRKELVGCHRDGPMEHARFQALAGMTVDSNGTIYVADGQWIRIIKDGIVSSIGCEKSVFPQTEATTIQNVSFSYASEVALCKDGSLLVLDENGLRRVDFTRGTVSARFPNPWNGTCVTVKQNGDILLGCRNGAVYLLEDTWKEARFLWIGFMKEDESYCLLRRLPKDLIKIIHSMLL